MPPLIAPACELARSEGITLVVETGNGTMVNSNYTARRLIDELDAKDVLKVLWDPANNCWCHERAYPDGYNEVRNGYLGHVHIKDVQVDTPKATLEVREMGKGSLLISSTHWPMQCVRTGMTLSSALKASTTLETETSRTGSGGVSTSSKRFSVEETV